MDFFVQFCCDWLKYFLSYFSLGGESVEFPTGRILIESDHVLGEGGFSTVFSARNPSSSAKYAIKRIGISDNDVSIEIEALRKFRHPNIVPLIDVARSSEKFIFLLFPLYSKGTLRTKLNSILMDGKIKQPLTQILNDFSSICHALRLLHENNPSYVHQDIKPENILIGDNEEPVLTDFGSIRPALREIHSRKQALLIADEAAMMCTMPYRAPELFDPPNDCVLDCRTDIWALGCLLFAWWFGYSPFECEFFIGPHRSSPLIKVVECSLSRVLSKIPRPKMSSGIEDRDDKIVCDLVEWILEKDFTVRPHISDILYRVREITSNIGSQRISV